MQALSQARLTFSGHRCYLGRRLLKLTVLSVQDAAYLNQLSLPHLLSLPYPQEACGTFSRLAVRLYDRSRTTNSMILYTYIVHSTTYYILLQYTSMYITLLYIASIYICSYTLLRITIAGSRMNSKALGSAV